MVDPNPYAPPETSHGRQPDRALPRDFVPLKTRTLLATIGVVSVTAASFALDGAQLFFGRELKAADPPLVPSLVVFAVAVLLLGSYLLSAIVYLMWIHRAAVNLRALGRTGMHYTPGWCVGWFFVPFANFFKPSAAVNELWRASEPDAGEGTRWMETSPSPLVRAWWAPWVIGSLLGNGSGRASDPLVSGWIGLAGSIFLAVAAYGCINVMKDIERRQQAAAVHGPSA